MAVGNFQPEFWRGRRVFVTGHTGFKGAWLCCWLERLGATLTGYALPPRTSPNLWDLTSSGALHSVLDDLRNPEALHAALLAANPEIVIHMAAQPLVRESYRDPVGTYASNVLGTVHLLQSCRALRQLECIVVVTSDKVYENHGDGRPFAEGDRLGGHDPYSNSKACTELVAASFRDSFFQQGPPLVTVRAGNVIGGGDWSEDRLIPDCVRALAANRPVVLRYPEAVRPWQHVLEPLSGYLCAAQAAVQRRAAAPSAVNFGPDPSAFRTVSQVVEAFSARFAGKPGWQRDAGTHPAEAAALTLTSALAQRELDWHPSLGIEDSLAWTADWYRAHAAREDMRALTAAQIARYQALLL